MLAGLSIATTGRSLLPLTVKLWLVIQRLRAEYQFGARRAFMQLLKASALLPAVNRAAWRSQSEASWLSVLGMGVRVSVAEGIVLVSAGGGVPPLSTGTGE